MGAAYPCQCSEPFERRTLHSHAVSSNLGVILCLNLGMSSHFRRIKCIQVRQDFKQDFKHSFCLRTPIQLVVSTVQ